MPLDHRAFADRAMQALEDDLAGGFLPPAVGNHLNRISMGQVPFTVDYAEQLKTLVGGMQRRSTDGNTRSEEHTSELQSLMRISYAVFCLKKKIPQRQNT